MRLISMTDFVLERGFLEMKYNGVQCRRYAHFLKQPIKLEMFVPCDEEGNVLQKVEPEMCCDASIHNGGCGCMGKPINSEWWVYEDAKKKVLFKHFEYCKRDSNILCVVYKDDYHLMLNTLETVEELTRYGFELSDNAVKQIML